MRNILYALVLSLAAAATANAGELKPLRSHSIDLGSVKGVAYYSVDSDGVRLVATLTQGETGTPIRVSTLLAPNQSVRLSVPGETNTPEIPVEFVRRGDRVMTYVPSYATN